MFVLEERRILEVPWPVSTNHYWRKNPRGMYITKAGKAFADGVRAAVLEQWGVQKKITSRVWLTVKLAPPDRRQRDIDNHAGKSLLDALTKAGVWEDDSQVDVLLAERCEIEEGGRAVLTFECGRFDPRVCPSLEEECRRGLVVTQR